MKIDPVLLAQLLPQTTTHFRDLIDAVNDVSVSLKNKVGEAGDGTTQK